MRLGRDAIRNDDGDGSSFLVKRPELTANQYNELWLRVWASSSRPKHIHPSLVPFSKKVKIALSEGVKAVWCNPKDSSTMIAELIGLGGSSRDSDSGARSNGSSGDGEGYRRTGDGGDGP